MDEEISNSQHELATLQTNIAEGQANVDKFKSQSVHYQKGTQVEQSRNNDLAKQLSQA